MGGAVPEGRGRGKVEWVRGCQAWHHPPCNQGQGSLPCQAGLPGGEKGISRLEGLLQRVTIRLLFPFLLAQGPHCQHQPGHLL